MILYLCCRYLHSVLRLKFFKLPSALCSVVFVFCGRLNVQVELLAGDSFVDLQDVLRGGLEMACCIIARGDPEVVSMGIIRRSMNITNLDEHLKDSTKQLDCWSDFLLGIFSLNGGRDDSNVESLSADGVGRTHHADVHI